MTIGRVSRVVGPTLLALAMLTVAVACSLFNSAPVPDFSFHFSRRDPPCTVTLDASAARDPDGIIIKYEWSFGDGASGAGRLTSHVYTTSGAFTITLTVKDDGWKTATLSKEINVLPAYVAPAPTPPPTPPPPTAPPSPILVRFEGSGYTQSPLPFPKEGAGSFFFMEYSGGERFSVVVLDCWGQWVKQLADEHGDYEGWAKSMGGSDYPGPYSLDVDADGSWAFTFLDAGVEPQAPRQTLRGCGSGNQFSLPFRLASGRVAFHYSDSGAQRTSYFLVSYSGVETPLAHEMDVLCNTYLLRVRSGGSWEVRVEQ